MTKKWHIHVEWVPRDFWVGVFVGEETDESGDIGDPMVLRRRFYICLIPTFPIVITQWKIEVMDTHEL